MTPSLSFQPDRSKVGPMTEPEELPAGVELRDFEDQDALRESIFGGLKEELSSKFPYSYGGVRMELEGDMDYEDKKPISLKDQKKALLTDKFLTKKLKGNLRLVDENTGDVLDRKENVTLMRVPYLTERGTFVHKGNEYSMINQARLIPGAYTRRTNSGDLETQFNVRSGSGRRMNVHVNPSDMQYKLKVGTSNLHLYSLLHDLGVDDQTLENSWGSEILKRNQSKYDRRALRRAYDKLVPKFMQETHVTDSGMAAAVRNAFQSAQANKEVLQLNLPNLMDRVKAASWRMEGQIKEAAEDRWEKKASGIPFSPDLPMDQIPPSGFKDWLIELDPDKPGSGDMELMEQWKIKKAAALEEFEAAPSPLKAAALKAMAVDPTPYYPEGFNKVASDYELRILRTHTRARMKSAGVLDEYLSQVDVSYEDLVNAAESEGLGHVKGASVDSIVGALVEQDKFNPGVWGNFVQSGFDMSETEIPGSMLAKCAMEKAARYGAGILFKNPDGTYLLERNHPEPGLDAELVGKLRPAGGGKSKRDRNLRATIIREIGEEFGLDEDYVKDRIRLLGYIKTGKFKDCAMFEMVDHGLKPGWYKATNSPTEKVELVQSTLDDPDYIGCKPHQLRKYSLKGYRGCAPRKRKGKWIGVDLDGTLAEQDDDFDIYTIGKPIPAMVRKVKNLMKNHEVKIFTARAHDKKAIPAVKSWCKEYLGAELEVTNEKDPGMIRLYDDRSVSIEKNKGTVKKAADDGGIDSDDLFGYDFAKIREEAEKDEPDGVGLDYLPHKDPIPEDGDYRGKRYGYIWERDTGEKYKLKRGVRNLEASAQVRDYKIKAGKLFEVFEKSAAAAPPESPFPDDIKTVGLTPIPDAVENKTPEVRKDRGFDQMFGDLMHREGGSKLVTDSGGKTKYGISANAYPDVDIENLTEQQAAEIYRRDYYPDNIPNPVIREKTFDLAVNTGQVTANKMLQNAIRKTGVDIQVDGIVGPNTLDALSRADSDEVFENLRSLQQEHYQNLIRKNPSKYGGYDAGWKSRASFDPREFYKQGSDGITLDHLEFEDAEGLSDGVSWYVTSPDSVLVSVPDSATTKDEELIEDYFREHFAEVEVDSECRADTCIDSDSWFPDREKAAREGVVLKERKIAYQVCPHCGEEIYEKHSRPTWNEDKSDFVREDGRIVMTHSCGGEYLEEPPSEDAFDFKKFMEGTL